MTTQDDCLFCRIATGELDSDKVLESGHAVAFRDRNPQAPTHVLVVPRAHHPNVAALAAADPAALADLIGVCAEVARAEGVADSGYRVVFNTGSGAGQSVFHVHGHLLGGRPLGWPPG